MTKKEIKSGLNELSVGHFQNEVIKVDSLVIRKNPVTGNFFVSLRVNVPRIQDLQTVRFIHTRMARFVTGLGIYYGIHEENVKMEHSTSISREHANITLHFKIEAE